MSKRAITRFTLLTVVSILLALVSTSFIAGSVLAAPFAYVTAPGANTVLVIDVATNTVVATIPVGGIAQDVAITPDGQRAYVTSAIPPTFSGQVIVIDTGTNTVVATIPGIGSVGVGITPDGQRAYVTNVQNNTVSVIDTATNTVVGTISVGVWPELVAVTPDGQRVYVTNFSSGTVSTVSVIDTGTNTVVATVPVGPNPQGVAITPDGSRVYVANTGGSLPTFNNTVSVIDTATNAVVETIVVGFFPGDVAISSDGQRAYVPNLVSNTVSVIDTATNAVVATIPVETRPRGVAITPDGQRVYVTHLDSSNVVSVIDTATNAVVATIPVGSTTLFVAITPPPVIQVIQVAIDIKPGSFPNSINPRSKGRIPVAILTTDTFDAATVDPTTVRFGPTGTEAAPTQSALEDVDGDGHTDLILHFTTQDTGIVCGMTSASLTGQTFDGRMIEGADSMKTVGCK